LNGGVINDTKENLKEAINGENYEWTDMYMKFAQEAADEGFEHISVLFKKVADIEKAHESRYTKLLQLLVCEEIYKKTKAYFGNVITVDICANQKKPLHYVQFVITQRRTFNIR
jgi:rubrerythrin